MPAWLRRGDAALTVALLVLFAGMLGEAQRYPRDSRLFPTIVAAAGVAIALLLLVNFARGRVRIPRGEEEGGEGAAPVWAAVLAPIAFGAVMWFLGFWIAAALACFLMPAAMGYRSLMRRTLLALGTLVVLYGLFPLALDLPMPRGVLIDSLFEVPDDDD